IYVRVVSAEWRGARDKKGTIRHPGRRTPGAAPNSPSPTAPRGAPHLPRPPSRAPTNREPRTPSQANVLSTIPSPTRRIPDDFVRPFQQPAPKHSSEAEFIMEQLARIPTRRELARTEVLSRSDPPTSRGVGEIEARA